jgi:hypothetical protein
MITNDQVRRLAAVDRDGLIALLAMAREQASWPADPDVAELIEAADRLNARQPGAGHLANWNTWIARAR